MCSSIFFSGSKNKLQFDAIQDGLLLPTKFVEVGHTFSNNDFFHYCHMIYEYQKFTGLEHEGTLFIHSWTYPQNMHFKLHVGEPTCWISAQHYKTHSVVLRCWMAKFYKSNIINQKKTIRDLLYYVVIMNFIQNFIMHLLFIKQIKYTDAQT